MKKILLILLFFLSFFRNVFAQSFDAALNSSLQYTIDSFRTAVNVKGISAAVLYPGKGSWKGVSGISYSGTPIRSDMEFGIASNTKLFTGVLL